MEISINAQTGDRIRYHRKAAGLTQKALAEMCGLSESAIRNYELGNRIPDFDTLKNIAASLNVSYYTLADAELCDIRGALHALFRMEKIYRLQPVDIDGEILLRIKGVIPQEELRKDPERLWDSPETILYHDIQLWFNVFCQYAMGEIDRETYLKWQQQFPDCFPREETDDFFGPEPEEEIPEPPRKRKRKPKTK